MREKQQEWCFRIDQEIKFSDIAFFVTLTYNNDNLIFADDEPCLYKRHLQLHFKRLRKALEPRSLKYYAVGEYGDHGNEVTPYGRPHFHYILFYRGKCDRFKLMNLIKDNWPYGQETRVYPVNGAQGYVTKYILKFDRREHMVPPFSMISHGIGIGYLSDAMIKYHRDNLINYAIKPGGYKVKLPRYYQDKIFTTYQRLLMKKRSDMYRKELEVVKLGNIDLLYQSGINPFQNAITNYQNRLYAAMCLYRNKKKL